MSILEAFGSQKKMILTAKKLIKNNSDFIIIVLSEKERSQVIEKIKLKPEDKFPPDCCHIVLIPFKSVFNSSTINGVQCGLETLEKKVENKELSVLINEKNTEISTRVSGVLEKVDIYNKFELKSKDLTLKEDVKAPYFYLKRINDDICILANEEVKRQVFNEKDILMEAMKEKTIGEYISSVIGLEYIFEDKPRKIDYKLSEENVELIKRELNTWVNEEKIGFYLFIDTFQSEYFKNFRRLLGIKSVSHMTDENVNKILEFNNIYYKVKTDKVMGKRCIRIKEI